MTSPVIKMNESKESHLRSIVEKIEGLEGQKKAVGDDIRAAYADAKFFGFDVKAIRQIVQLRKMDPADRDTYEAILTSYQQALGMLADTPLGEAAIGKARVDFAPASEDRIMERAAS